MDLTPAQKKLATLLFTTKITAPVGRRKKLPDGKFQLYKADRPTAPIDFAQNDEEFALKSHETNIEAPLSPVYINLRNLPEEVLDQIGVVFAEMDEGEKPDVCTGIPKAGVPLAKSYSQHTGVPLIDVFGKEESADGTRKIIGKKGVAGDGKKLRIVDDLVTKADTKVEAAKAAESLGFKVLDITILTDRQQGGIDQLKNMGYKVRVAFTVSQLLDFGLSEKHITEDQYNSAKTYLGLK